jgi:hypothetical protein
MLTPAALACPNDSTELFRTNGDLSIFDGKETAGANTDEFR